MAETIEDVLTVYLMLEEMARFNSRSCEGSYSSELESLFLSFDG